MKIIALNGSHRSGKLTTDLLEVTLEAAREAGCDVELVELADLNIAFCTGCNACLRGPKCSISGDDMEALGEKLLAADGILLGSPVYWSNVSARMKNVMDRTRPYHMTKNLLAGKVGGAVTGAGLNLGGQGQALAIMQEFLVQQGLILADCRNPDAMVATTGVGGSLAASYADGKTQYRRKFTDDERVLEDAKQLGRNMARLLAETKGLRS